MSRPRRLETFEYTGPNRYFLTFCVRSRRTAFLDPAVAHETLAQFARTATEEHFSVLAYCLMPDHVHLLVEGTTQAANLRRFAKMSKQRSGAMHAQRGSGKLWQEGYYDRVLRQDEDIKQLARYILENPVRAALVNTPADYPYLGSDVWSLAELLDVYQ